MMSDQLGVLTLKALSNSSPASRSLSGVLGSLVPGSSSSFCLSMCSYNYTTEPLAPRRRGLVYWLWCLASLYLTQPARPPHQRLLSVYALMRVLASSVRALHAPPLSGLSVLSRSPLSKIGTVLQILQIQGASHTTRQVARLRSRFTLFILSYIFAYHTTPTPTPRPFARNGDVRIQRRRDH